MTRKTFREVAQTIRESDAEPETKRELANTFARTFAANNSRFDRFKFLTACGFEAATI